MSLLSNYCRNKDVKTSIRVGIVGLPNVGKSSLINSLKRNRACNVGATPGKEIIRSARFGYLAPIWRLFSHLTTKIWVLVEKRLDAKWSGFRMPFEYNGDLNTGLVWYNSQLITYYLPVCYLI